MTQHGTSIADMRCNAAFFRWLAEDWCDPLSEASVDFSAIVVSLLTVAYGSISTYEIGPRSRSVESRHEQPTDHIAKIGPKKIEQGGFVQ